MSKMSIWEFGLVAWLNKKIVDPLLQIITKGAEPSLLAFSTALGLTLGIFPICGVTVFLCGLAITSFGKRCHAPTVMLANFIATPIELSLVIPFLRLGELITGGPSFPLTPDALKKVLMGQASRDVLLSIVHALLGWTIAAPVILTALYYVFVPTFRYLVHRFSSVSSSQEKNSHSQAHSKLKARTV
ncbi:hypothetical protein HPP92_009217 [Vanilla planifolia]|uniref:DUF2062 domain-containing protein n=1 Tax=Vanilla planifolia TaxID=51239 RepID=A0A835V580_VANPL|nr:hypothetical protein HPP92_009217 [Vanilla planifolia]